MLYNNILVRVVRFTKLKNINQKIRNQNSIPYLVVMVSFINKI